MAMLLKISKRKYEYLEGGKTSRGNPCNEIPTETALAVEAIRAARQMDRADKKDILEIARSFQRAAAALGATRQPKTILERCKMSSCHRHQKCMYPPCRAQARLEAGGHQP
jgi:hypothetical protein